MSGWQRLGLNWFSWKANIKVTKDDKPWRRDDDNSKDQGKREQMVAVVVCRKAQS